MSVTFNFNEIFPIICLVCGVISLVKPKYFHTVLAVLIMSYGLLEVIHIRF